MPIKWNEHVYNKYDLANIVIRRSLPLLLDALSERYDLNLQDHARDLRSLPEFKIEIEPKKFHIGQIIAESLWVNVHKWPENILEKVEDKNSVFWALTGTYGNSHRCYSGQCTPQDPCSPYDNKALAASCLILNLERSVQLLHSHIAILCGVSSYFRSNHWIGSRDANWFAWTDKMNGFGKFAQGQLARIGTLLYNTFDCFESDLCLPKGQVILRDPEACQALLDASLNQVFPLSVVDG